MEEIFPLLVFNKNRALVAAALQSPKAYQKSLEQGEIWAFHPETKRVLPVAETRGFHLEFKGDHTEILLENYQTWHGLAPLVPESSSTPELPVNLPNASGSILEGLAAIIHQRNLERPVGSYTTHLFEKGEEKIRKKTGEEAVELILARDDKEMVSEAADLIYHMLVLFEVRNIPLEAILQELSGRMK